MKSNKKISITVFSLIFIVLLASFTAAFAVSRPDMERDDQGNLQLILSPGETRAFGFVLQNGGGTTSDVDAKVDIIKGSEVIKITDPDRKSVV